jgi:NSS family neurotransmitter:Na+ symporter
MFDIMDYLSANILLPLGGLLIAVFVAWVMKKSTVLNELYRGISENRGLCRTGNVWFFLLKFVAPVLIVLVFLSITGII